MDTYDIFKKLTTNLKFENKQKASSNAGPKAIEPSAPTAASVGNGSQNPGAKLAVNSKKIAKKSAPVSKETALESIMRQYKEKLNHLRNVNHINVNGNDIPDPVESFEQLRPAQAESQKEDSPLAPDYTQQIPKKIFENLLGYKFEKPSPVQMQAIPVLLNSREIMACAPTGSGKTIAYLFPVLCHIKEPKRQGIRSLVLAPTRELARQIYLEAIRLSEGTNIRIHLINKTCQEKKNLKTFKIYDMLITTPNKLIHLMRKKNSKLNLNTVEWLVIDEADKLFEEGENSFREQLGTIYKACNNPSVKRAMFSATYTTDVEEWCKLTLNNMVQVSIGRKNLASFTVEQEIQYVGNEQGKLMAIRNIFKAGFEPPILVFVQSKDRANDLFKELLFDNLNVDVINSDRSQAERDNTIRAFRQGKIWILICTELMSRGIDFKGVNMVINYDFPQSAISYVHRIGRSGRAGRMGRAITFFTDQDLPYLKMIASIIKESGGQVPAYMLELKKPSKSMKRGLQKKAIKRKRIPVSSGPDEEPSKRIKRTKKSKPKQSSVPREKEAV